MITRIWLITHVIESGDVSTEVLVNVSFFEPKPEKFPDNHIYQVDFSANHGASLKVIR